MKKLTLEELKAIFNPNTASMRHDHPGRKGGMFAKGRVTAKGNKNEFTANNDGVDSDIRSDSEES